MKLQSSLNFINKTKIHIEEWFTGLLFWLRLSFRITSSRTISPPSFKKISSSSYGDILSQWVYLKYPNENIVVLTNIDVEAKHIQFWAKIPQTEMIHFLKDVVILRCKDSTEMHRLIDNISEQFADAYGYSAGYLITYNKEEAI